MTSDFLDTPGARLRTVREQMRLTQGDLAQALGVSQSYLSRIERGGTSINPVASRAAELLGVSADYLLMLSESPTPAQGDAAANELARKEAINLRHLRMVIDEVPAHQRPRLISFLIKQVAIIRETFPLE